MFLSSDFQTCATPSDAIQSEKQLRCLGVIYISSTLGKICMELEYVRSLFFRKLAPLKITITSHYYSKQKNIVFAGLSNGSVIAWDLYVPIPIARIMIIQAHDSDVTAMIYHSQHNLLITGGKDQRIRIWDVVFSSLLDVSGTRKYQIEHYLLKDKFYAKHGGTVAPQQMPNDINQATKKTVLVQEFADNVRQIMQLKEQGQGFISLCEDGTVSYYAPGNIFETRHVLKYLKFEFKDKIGLGYEKNDQQRRMEIMDLASQATKSLQPQSGLVSVKMDEKTKTLVGDESPLLSSKVIPICCIQTRQDGNIFVGDSMGQVHCLTINQDMLQHEYCIGNVHRLSIVQMMYLTKENAIVTCSQDGTLRSIVSVTGQVYYSYNNQRIRSFVDICNITRNIEGLGDVRTKQDQPSNEPNSQNGQTVSAEMPDSAQNDEKTGSQQSKQRSQVVTRGMEQRAGKDIQALANVMGASEMKKNDMLTVMQDNLIIAVDSDNFVTVIDASVGNQITDIDFSDIVPNRIVIQSAFEKYKIDSSFPVVYDFSLSKNSAMYGVQKQSTDENDMKEMLKQQHDKRMKKQMADEDDQENNQHPMLKLFDDIKINKTFVMDKECVCFVRNHCIDIYRVKFKLKQSEQKIQKPVKLMALLLMSVKSEEYRPNGLSKKEAEKNVFDDQTYLQLDPLLVFRPTGKSQRSKSSFGGFMNKYRLQKSHLDRINDPLQQLRSISPLLPRDLDSIESFVKNNIDQNGDLPKIESPTRHGIKNNLVKMSVPFYVIMATEDNIINNFDPRVVRKPYHNYTIDFQMICNAEQVDFSRYSKIKTTYRQLSTLQDGVYRQEKLPVGELPKIQPMPNPNNIYARLTKGTLRNGKEMATMALKQATNATTQRESEYKFYHVNQDAGFDSQHDLGFYDQDILYNLVDDGSMKNDVNKMDIEVKKVSELPATNCFCCIVDADQKSQRDVLIFGHDDGSLTYQNLLTGQMMRIFGCHSASLTQIFAIDTTSGYQIISISADSNIFTVQLPKTNAFRVSFVSCCSFPFGQLAYAFAAGESILFGDADGNVYVSQIPITQQSHYGKIFSAAEFFLANDNFFQLSKQRAKAQVPPPDTPSMQTSRKTTRKRIKVGSQDAGEVQEKPYYIQCLEVREEVVFLIFENGYCLVFQDMLKDLHQFQQSFSAGQRDAKLRFSESRKFKSYASGLSLPNHAFKIDCEGDNVSTVYIAAPLQKGWKLLETEKGSGDALIQEMHGEEMEEQFQSYQKQREEQLCRTKVVTSKYLTQNTNVKLSELTSQRADLVSVKDLEAMGKDLFLLVGYASGRLAVFTVAGEIAQEYKFQEEITSIVSVNRDIIGIRIMNQMAEIERRGELLQTFWVGMADSSIDSDLCEHFAIM